MDASPGEEATLPNEKEDPVLLKEEDNGHDLGIETSFKSQTGHLGRSGERDKAKPVSCTRINEGAGPSKPHLLCANALCDEKTPERQIFKTVCTRQDVCSSCVSDWVDLAMSYRSTPYPSPSPKSERRRKPGTATSPAPLYELIFRDSSSDDESDGEKDSEYDRNFRRIFGSNESPEGSDLRFKIHDSKDRSSCDLIDGISYLHLSDSNRSSTEDDPGRAHSSEQKEPTREATVSVPATAIDCKASAAKIDPETGERLPVSRELFPDSDHTYFQNLITRMTQENSLKPSDDYSKPSTCLHKRKANGHETTPEYSLRHQLIAGTSQEAVAKGQIQKPTTPERPVKRGRLSLELGQEETNFASAALTEDHAQSEAKQGTSGLLIEPGKSSWKSVSPSKRKAEEICTSSEADSPEERRKRAKSKH